VNKHYRLGDANAQLSCCSHWTRLLTTVYFIAYLITNNSLWNYAGKDYH